jgi:hypothetical protein
MVRATWLKEVAKIDYKFFYGKGSNREPLEDEVFLDVEDSYESLSWKTRAIMKWAVDHNYDAVFKCDDDTFVFPERLINIIPGNPYEGRVNASNKSLVPRGWCSGFAYWLSGRALDIIANAPEPTHKAEDLWVGMTLSSQGIYPVKQAGFQVMSIISPALWGQFKDQIIAACEFKDSQMLDFNKAMRSNEPYKPNLLSPADPRTGKRVMKFGEVLRRRH